MIVLSALVPAIFLLVLGGGIGVFLLLEAYALSNKEDDFHTFSTYIKRARRRAGIAGALLLTLSISAPAVWLFGHLVLEAW